MKNMFLALVLLSSFGLMASDPDDQNGGTAVNDSPRGTDSDTSSFDGDEPCPFKGLFSFDNKFVSIAASVGVAAVLSQVAKSAEVVWSEDKKKVGILGAGLSYNSAAQSCGWVTCQKADDTLYGKTLGRQVALNTRVRVEAPAGVLATLAGVTVYAAYLVLRNRNS